MGTVPVLRGEYFWYLPTVPNLALVVQLGSSVIFEPERMFLFPGLFSFKNYLHST